MQVAGLRLGQVVYKLDLVHCFAARCQDVHSVPELVQSSQHVVRGNLVNDLVEAPRELIHLSPVHYCNALAGFLLQFQIQALDRHLRLTCKFLLERGPED